jgi:hypothetical protein
MGVTLQEARANIPDLDCIIVGASRKNVFGELKIHDIVGVAGKDLCRTSTVLPSFSPTLKRSFYTSFQGQVFLK